ncbi:hypothetical protein Q5O12_27405, partial [Klebsiella pneumoniae]|uniref:hypothetical protein n=1 Tax=Klebsiella pneumoniae TaxID=573 RepID=UPI0027317715
GWIWVGFDSNTNPNSPTSQAPNLSQIRHFKSNPCSQTHHYIKFHPFLFSFPLNFFALYTLFLIMKGEVGYLKQKGG